MPLDESAESQEMRHKESRLVKIWNSNPDNPAFATPERFINWSIAKGFSPVWLEAVKEQGFYVDRLAPKVPIDVPDTPRPEAKPWQEVAREFADEFDLRDMKAGVHSSQRDMSKRVAKELREKGIHGLRGGPISDGTVVREALQGEKWKRQQKNKAK